MVNFKDDLIFGQYFEKQSLLYLDSYDLVTFPCKYTKHPDYDYVVTHKCGRIEKYECKADRRCNFTGSFFIETANKNGKPSGLSTTKANTYILMRVMGTEIIQIYFVSVEILKQWEKLTCFSRFETPTTGFLLPCKYLESNLLKDM